MKNGVKNIQVAAYNGVCTVLNQRLCKTLHCFNHELKLAEVNSRSLNIMPKILSEIAGLLGSDCRSTLHFQNFQSHCLKNRQKR